MQSSEDIKKMILDFACHDERVRAVLLNGSRANQNIKPDKYQDFDILFLVRDIKSFTSDHNWTNVFGKKIICQLPDEMIIGNNDNNVAETFSYLMLFEDGNRIDLTLFPDYKFHTHFHYDSLTVVWFDKDQLFTQINSPGEGDYLITVPTEKEFLDTCNEFWWVSTYVAKGLLRNQLIYAKEMLECYVRPMLIKIIEWYVGTKTAFTVSTGRAGKCIEKYLPKTTFDIILATYSDAQFENNRNALFAMTELFAELASAVGEKLQFHYNKTEEANVTRYLKKLFSENKYS
jgi:aminoglycoside 6-adenylyltransferase